MLTLFLIYKKKLTWGLFHTSLGLFTFLHPNSETSLAGKSLSSYTDLFLSISFFKIEKNWLSQPIFSFLSFSFAFLNSFLSKSGVFSDFIFFLMKKLAKKNLFRN